MTSEDDNIIHPSICPSSHFVAHSVCFVLCPSISDDPCRDIYVIHYVCMFGYIFQIMGGVIAWRSHLQECVALLTTEVKYIALSEACKEAIWLSQLPHHRGIR